MIDIAGTLRRGWRQLIAHIDFPLFFITLATSGAPQQVKATVDRLFAQSMHVEHWEP